MKSETKYFLSSFNKEIIVSVIVFVIVECIQIPSDAPIIIKLIYSSLAFVAAFSIFLIWRLLRYIDILLILLHLSDEQPKLKSSPANLLFIEGVRKLSSDINMLHSKDGMLLDGDNECKDFFSFCFEVAGQCHYFGIDGHCPSQYMKRFRDYLLYQDASLSNGKKQHVRILAVEDSLLREDYARNTSFAKEFYNWHIEKGVSLLQISPSIAHKHKELAGINTIDVGLWVNRYVVFFTPQTYEPGGDSTLKVSLCDDNTAQQFRNTRKYLELVLNDIKEILIVGDSLGFKTPEKSVVERYKQILK